MLQKMNKNRYFLIILLFFAININLSAQEKVDSISVKPSKYDEKIRKLKEEKKEVVKKAKEKEKKEKEEAKQKLEENKIDSLPFYKEYLGLSVDSTLSAAFNKIADNKKNKEEKILLAKYIIKINKENKKLCNAENEVLQKVFTPVALFETDSLINNLIKAETIKKKLEAIQIIKELKEYSEDELYPYTIQDKIKEKKERLKVLDIEWNNKENKYISNIKKKNR